MKSELPSHSQKILLAILTKHLKGYEPYTILLFGSFAKHSQKDGSDIDIAIKSRKPLSLTTAGWIELDIEESNIPQAVDVLDYHQLSPEFQQLIDREGLGLFTSEPST